MSKKPATSASSLSGLTGGKHMAPAALLWPFFRYPTLDSTSPCTARRVKMVFSPPRLDHVFPCNPSPHLSCSANRLRWLFFPSPSGVVRLIAGKKGPPLLRSLLFRLAGALCQSNGYKESFRAPPRAPPLVLLPAWFVCGDTIFRNTLLSLRRPHFLSRREISA